MDEIAPEYDVVVLGTGMSRSLSCSENGGLQPYRLDRMRPIRVIIHVY